MNAMSMNDGGNILCRQQLQWRLPAVTQQLALVSGLRTQDSVLRTFNLAFTGNEELDARWSFAFYALKRICSARKGIKMSAVKASMAGAKKTY